MTLHTRIEDCKWALATCRNLADLRDVWGERVAPLERRSP